MPGCREGIVTSNASEVHHADLRRRGIRNQPPVVQPEHVLQELYKKIHTQKEKYEKLHSQGHLSRPRITEIITKRLERSRKRGL